jgi:hypothetical protein
MAEVAYGHISGWDLSHVGMFCLFSPACQCRRPGGGGELVLQPKTRFVSLARSVIQLWWGNHVCAMCVKRDRTVKSACVPCLTCGVGEGFLSGCVVGGDDRVYTVRGQ